MRQQMGGDLFGSILKIITLFVVFGSFFIWIVPAINFRTFAVAWTIVFGLIGAYKVLVWALDKYRPID